MLPADASIISYLVESRKSQPYNLGAAGFTGVAQA